MMKGEAGRIGTTGQSVQVSSLDNRNRQDGKAFNLRSGESGRLKKRMHIASLSYVL